MAWKIRMIVADEELFIYHFLHGLPLAGGHHVAHLDHCGASRRGGHRLLGEKARHGLATHCAAVARVLVGAGL